MLNNTSPGIIPKQEGGINYHKRGSPKSLEYRSNTETMNLEEGEEECLEDGS
jgi:hypothetical protein